MSEHPTEQVIADLRQSLAWLDLALATLHEGVVVLDGDMKILFANDALANLLGKPRILLLGSTICEALPLRQNDELITGDTYLEAAQGGNASSLSGIYSLTTTSKPVSVELSVAHIENTEHTVLVVRNVTERLEAQAQRLKIAQEKEARRIAERAERRMQVQYRVASVLAGPMEEDEAICTILQTVCESLGWQIGALWRLDTESQSLTYALSWTGEDGTMQPFVDDSRARVFTKGQGLPGRVWEKSDAIWSTDVTKDHNFPRKNVAAKLDLHGAFAVPLKSGKDFFGVMEFFRNPVSEPDVELLTSIATIGIQMAEFIRRKSVERALTASEQRLRFVADSMPHIIYTAQPDGSVDYMNPQGLKYSGLSCEMFNGNGWLKFIHPEDVETSVKAWQHSLQSGEPFEHERRLRRHDGVYRWHLSRATALRNDNGEVLMWIGTDTNIEDFMRTVELEKITTSLREQRSRLLELNDAKDEFISLASHQLRTPATGVKQFVSMLIDGYGGQLTDDQLVLAEKACESNERQIAIINDLLKVAQVDAGKVVLKKQTADLVALLRNVLDEQLGKFAERQQQVAYVSTRKKLDAHVDVRHLRMALENIIDNASKYTEVNKSIEVRLAKKAGKAVISVQDQGVGIHPDDIGKIFHKFIRVSNPLSVLVGGTGLGLYWCKKVIELHGGTIAAESKVGEGTTFTITLPL